MVRHFTGIHDHKLDDKGRVALPTDFRKVLTTRGSDGALVIVPQLEDPRSHVAFTAESYDKLIERHNTTDYGSRKRQRQMAVALINRANHVQVDDNGRILISKGLREVIGLVKDVRFAGNASCFEIWTPEGYNAFEAELGDDGDDPVYIDLRGLDG
ncbi:MAG: hypothetical protein AAF409_02520 [Pseudomonadota bacterium]